MTADGYDELGRPRPRGPGRHRSSRPMWLGGSAEPERAGSEPGIGPVSGATDGADMCPECESFDVESCDECARGPVEGGGLGGGVDPDPDLGEIVVILLVSTLAGLRDRLERDGFGSAAGLVHDLVEVADDYIMRYQP